MQRQLNITKIIHDTYVKEIARLHKTEEEARLAREAEESRRLAEAEFQM